MSARRADGSAAVLVGIDTAAVIDLETRAVRTEPLPFAITPLVRVALGPDAGVVAVADAGTLRIWDMDTGTVETASLPDGRPTVVGFDGAGHVAVVVGSEDPTLVFFDAATAERVTPVADTFAGAILDARVGSSGLLAATSAGARRWQAGATTPERIDAPWGTDTDLAFAADRDDVVATLTSEGLFAWRGAQEVPLFQRTADTQRWPFAVSNDGSLAASTLDGLVRVWDGETGLPIGAPRTVGGGLVTEMAFTTGQSVALLVVDTTKVEPTLELVEIDLDPEQWAAQACAVANRNLGEDEWARDVGPLVPYRSTCL